VLLPLFSGVSPVYITEYIQKYCFIENFIKLPFQRVLIHLNRSPNEGAMAVLFPLLHAVRKISERATFGNSAIPACRNIRLTWFLIRWKRNFMGLLNIQRYPVVLPWGCAEIDGNRSFLWIDPNMLMNLILWSLGVTSRLLWLYVLTIAGPASSMMKMVCLLHDFALAKVTGAFLATWLLPTPIACTNKPPQNISLKTLIDTLAYLV
jgi:hypothetical protein